MDIQKVTDIAKVQTDADEKTRNFERQLAIILKRILVDEKEKEKRKNENQSIR